jgi:hypothetical protein
VLTVLCVLGICFAIFHFKVGSPQQKASVTSKSQNPVQAATRGVLNVWCNPAMAYVSVDGSPKGNAPVSIELPLGEHTVRLTYPGFISWQDKVRLDKPTEYPLKVELRREVKTGIPKAVPVPVQPESPVARKETRAVLKVESNPQPASVYVDGISKGTSPAVLDLPFGMYTIRVSKAGYQDREYAIQLREAKEYSLALDLAMSKVQTAPVPSESPNTAQTDSVLQNASLFPYQTGLAYFEGQGVIKDYQEALKWFTRAAETGDDAARFYIGYMYQNGLGVWKDYTEAMKWYLKSAENSRYGDAFYMIGSMYEQGQGVRKDYREAQTWYQAAGSRHYITNIMNFKRPGTGQ